MSRGRSRIAQAKMAIDITDELDRLLRGAASNILCARHRDVPGALRQAAKRLDDEDVTRVLPTGLIAFYRAQIEDVKLQLAAALKCDALDRARPLIAELEALVSPRMLDGLEQLEAYCKTRKVASVVRRIEGAKYHVPAGDPDIGAIDARVVAALQTVDIASAAWGKPRKDAAVDNSAAEPEADA